MTVCFMPCLKNPLLDLDCIILTVSVISFFETA
jgi:hypothetical protein